MPVQGDEAKRALGSFFEAREGGVDGLCEVLGWNTNVWVVLNGSLAG